MKSSAILPAVMIVLAIISVQGSVHAASSDEMKFYATGDPVYVNGEAPGSQSSGLAAWLFGPNYWSMEYIDSNSDGSYTYEIDGGLTGSLSPGQYFVVIQHPMYNGQFDVYLQAGVPGAGQTSVVSNGGGRFIIDGSSKLQGSAAAYALMNMLDSPDIDDTYTSTTFFLEEPWIRAADGEVYPTDSEITIEGTTNIAVGENLIYTFYPASGDIPSSKQDAGTSYTTEMAGSSYVEYGMPYNLWTVGIDTTGMDSGTYIFTIESVEGSYTTQKYITLYDQIEETPVYETEATVTPEITKAAETPTGGAAATETPQSAIPAFLPLLASLFILLCAAGGKLNRRNRK